MRIAYVVGRYPAVSHTFIRREVLALRRLGVQVETISIHRARPQDALAEVDRREAASTFSVLPARWVGLLAAHLQAVITRPRRYGLALALGQRLARPGLRGRLWSLFYFAEAGVVWRQCHRLDVDHIHVHHLNQASDVTMMAIVIEGPRSGGRPWPWSYTMHGPDEFADQTLFRLAEKAADAAAIACISDFARSQVMALLPEEQWDKLQIVRCGVDTDEFVAPAVRARRPGDASLRVLYVGRMVPVKGQLLLVQAVAELRRRGVEVTATLIGEGPRRQTLARRVATAGLTEHIRLAGAVGGDEIAEFYADADVFVLPSFAEGVPVVLMEAMAMGLPVVTTRVGGIPELVEHGVSGIVVAPGRVDTLVEAVQRLAADPDLRARMGAAGQAMVRSGYDVAESGRRLRDLFSAAISGRP